MSGRESPVLPPRQQVTQKFPVVGERDPDAAALDLESWRLTVSGEVEQPQSWTYDAVQQLPQVEVTHDIHCVTRWSRLGCRWRGVAFETIAAQVRPTAKARFVQFIAYSARQHDSTLPLDLCRRDGVLLAWAIDGEPLSVPHGYPLRVVAPTRYFYKSVKWVREIRFLETDIIGFWERGGYHNNGDFWWEERYVSGNLNADQIERLRRSGNFRLYRGQVLLSLDLSGADLRGANLTNSDLRGANLYGADLSEADLEGTLLMGADLRYCSLRNARLAAAEFCRDGEPSVQVEGLDVRGAMTEDLLEDQHRFLRQRGVL